jgi:anti-sigma factor RsiW
MHLSEGTIRAYQDGELEETTRQRTEQHLANCPRCQGKAQRLQNRAAISETGLTTLTPSEGAHARPLAFARQHLEERISLTQEKEQTSMFRKIFTKPYRPVWYALAVIALLVVFISVAPLRALANNFLGLFRIQQISVIEVDPSQLQVQLGNSAEFEAILAENVTFEGGGDMVQVASQEEAVSQAGFEVRLPENIQNTPSFSITPAGKVNFEVDLARVRALLKTIDHADIQLPETLEGVLVTLDVPPTLTTNWGNCKYDAQIAKEAGYDPDQPNTYPLLECTTLIQLPSPTILAPDGLDLNGLGEAYLQVLGMSSTEAARFARNIDWATTIVIPIPRNASTYQEVSVDGVQGTLIQDARGNRDNNYMLVWVKNGILYALSGPGDASTAVNIADSLK